MFSFWLLVQYVEIPVKKVVACIYIALRVKYSLVRKKNYTCQLEFLHCLYYCNRSWPILMYIKDFLFLTMPLTKKMSCRYQ